MLNGSLVELHAWLHSYLCFSFLEKWFLGNLDTSLIPPWHLAFYWALKFFSYRNLDRSSTAGGSNEKVPGSSKASQQLVRSIELLFLLLVFLPRHLQLSTTFFSTPTSTDVSTPLSTFICRDLLRFYLNTSCDPPLISVDLPLDCSDSSCPKHSHLTPKPLHQGFFKLSQDFLHLVSF